MRKSLVLWMASAMLAPGSVAFAAPEKESAAETKDADTRFAELLAAIDVVPADREALERAFPDIQVRLQAAAKDSALPFYSRYRAVSLLSFFPEEGIAQSLRGLSEDENPELRRIAIYTLARTFGATADVDLVRFLERKTQDPVADVAEHAIRALRWVDHKEIVPVLERLRLQAPKAQRALVEDVIQRRDARLKGPRRGH